jgi:hypothetical protein
MCLLEPDPNDFPKVYEMMYDVFICHASEDKDTFVRPLAEALCNENIAVWYDEFTLKLGDSIRRSLDKGLKQSRFGIVVLSKAFFEKKWPQYELDGLAECEMKGADKVILPIWHGVNHDDIMQYSPSLAGRKAASSFQGIKKVLDEILDVVQPQGSPLIVARDTLIEWGVVPPVITDQYWLDVVAASNRLPGYGAFIPEESTWSRWSFPLPSKEGGAKNWGDRLAWTAMQMKWVDNAEEVPITPLTPPDQVHDFISDHPGLLETCLTYPQLIAEYAPQLTIRDFSGDLNDSFEEAYKQSSAKHRQARQKNSTAGSALTINGKSPLCDEEWALRHHSFGDYQPIYVTDAYFSGGMFGPRVSPYEHADHLFWLLSSASGWLPRRIHSFLIEGTLDWHAWIWGPLTTNRGGAWNNCGALHLALYNATEGKKKKFSWNKIIEEDVTQMISFAIETLSLPDSPKELLDRFRKKMFPDRWIQRAINLKKRRSEKK